MAKRITKSHMAHIDAAAAHLHAIGAKHPGMPDTTPLGSKADMSLGDQMQAVAQSVYMAGTNSDGYCCIEEVFDDYAIIEVSGGTYYRADYSMAADGAVTLAARDSWVEVEEVWQPVSASAAAKAGAILSSDSTATPYASMKALGNRRIEVKVSYYGHKNGKDSHGEYFSPNTDFDAENFPTPPLLYYHGFNANGKKMGKPVVTGAFVSRRRGTDGHYLTYDLKNNPYADLQWDSAQKSECVVSPGTIAHLIRKNPDGELTYWALAEISAWDYAPNRAPANLHSVAAPVLKALYISEGLDLPTSILTANGAPPETPGDGVSAGDPGAINGEHADEMIADRIAQALLTFRKRTQ